MRFDDFDTQVCPEDIAPDEFEEAMEGFNDWFTELAIMDILVNDDQWRDFV